MQSIPLSHDCIGNEGVIQQKDHEYDSHLSRVSRWNDRHDLFELHVIDCGHEIAP